MRLVLTLLAALCAASPAFAQCEGKDLRSDLSEAERTEIEARLDAVPYPEGNHWIATRGDEVIHLVGTIHLPDPRLDQTVETLRPVIEDARLLLLELTARDQAELQSKMTNDPSMLVLEDTSLPELMTEEEWQALAAAAEARGIPAIMAAKFKPWYLSMILALPACAMETLTEGGGLDARLQEVAEETGTEMAALEDFTTVFDLFGAESLDLQVQMLKSALIQPQSGDDMFATLVATYFEEKPAESWETTRVLSRRLSPLSPEEADASFDQMEDMLLIGRNHDWMPVILNEAGPEPIVVAAGAAHLQGTDGLLKLLEAEGFTLTRAAFR